MDKKISIELYKMLSLFDANRQKVVHNKIDVIKTTKENLNLPLKYSKIKEGE